MHSRCSNVLSIVHAISYIPLSLVVAPYPSWLVSTIHTVRQSHLWAQLSQQSIYQPRTPRKVFPIQRILVAKQSTKEPRVLQGRTRKMEEESMIWSINYMYNKNVSTPSTHTSTSTSTNSEEEDRSNPNSPPLRFNNKTLKWSSYYYIANELHNKAKWVYSCTIVKVGSIFAIYGAGK